MKYRKPNLKDVFGAIMQDEQSIKIILKFYDAYITKLCLKPYYSEIGKRYLIVDQELKGRIISALIKAILDFKIY